MAVACAWVEWMPVSTGMTEADREKRASRAIGETMLERSDDYPKGALKTHKKYGGVLLSLYFANKEA